MVCSWTTYLSAMLTPLIAIIVAFIAFRQWRTARNRLKLDLFDRRLSVYTAARTFVANIVIDGGVSRDATFKFLSEMREAKWLFSKEIEAYLLAEIYRKAVGVMTYQSALEGMDVGEQRTATVHQQSEIMQHLEAQLDVMDGKFSPFLKLAH
jgi:hypothetical protein